MVGSVLAGGETRLREQVVKNALAALDWAALRAHLDQIAMSRAHLTELCGHIRRYSDLICKYPRRDFELQRTRFFDEMRTYAEVHLGAEAADEVARETVLITQIEHGYRGILDALGRCVIGQRPAVIRVSGSISRACHEYQELMHRRDKAMADSTELFLMSGLRLKDDNEQGVSLDAVLDGLSESVAMTLIMEAYKNSWFVDDNVVLPDLPAVDDEVRYQSGSTQVLALYWRQWQRFEKRRRFLNGDLVSYSGDQLPPGLPDQIDTLITYRPEDEGQSEREVYDYLANVRLHDRLIQTFMEMEIEDGLSGQGVGIAGGAALPPTQLVSMEEAHAGISLSEVLGYSIVGDEERPGGLRLLEWVRGYIVLKEIAKARTRDQTAPGDTYVVPLEQAELLGTLQACGLKDDLAERFIALTCLHRSARDMFDCPLVRIGASGYLLFAPAVIDLNVVMAVLSNLSNRGTELSRKGKAFEDVIHNVFRERGMPVFGFCVRRGGEEYEYDTIVPWDGYLFVFECKNRSLSGNDPAQAYYFDLEVASQAKQVRRLADALVAHPDIIEQEMGAEYTGLTIIPCVLHSLPYSRADDIDGVHFTDWSALTRFFDQPYLRIKVPHRVGNATLLHRTAIRKFWKGDTPTADDFLGQLRNPFQLELSMKHLEIAPVQFAISEVEIVVTPELVRAEMTTRSISEAVGVDADKVLQEIAAIGENAKSLRSELERRAGTLSQSGKALSNDV
jgi:hypothetical protein